jgi:hypothetical protein
VFFCVLVSYNTTVYANVASISDFYEKIITLGIGKPLLEKHGASRNLSSNKLFFYSGRALERLNARWLLGEVRNTQTFAIWLDPGFTLASPLHSAIPKSESQQAG